jgi:amidase
LPLDGMLPQAPSSDTTGWFARDAATFARVGQMMLGEDLPQELPKKLVHRRRCLSDLRTTMCRLR